MRRWLPIPFLLGLAGTTLALVAVSQASPSVDALRNQIDGTAAHEQALVTHARSGASVIAALSQQLTTISSRVAAVQQQLGQDRARLSALVSEAQSQRRRVAELRAELIRQRSALARWLVAVYEQGRPNTLEVLTTAHGFADVLERMDFLNRLSEHGGQITKRISGARTAARHGLARVVALGVAQQLATAASAAEGAALESMSTALDERRAALAQARQLQLIELSHARSQRAALQSSLAQRLAALSAPAPAPAAAPGAGATTTGATSATGWAIPWPIVQCESGGQNLPPNASGASGYYQILSSTWKGAGGTTAQAFQAPKAEQDAVAARLWAGGAGASNWVCASLVRAG